VPGVEQRAHPTLADGARDPGQENLYDKISVLEARHDRALIVDQFQPPRESLAAHRPMLASPAPRPSPRCTNSTISAS
jgi:hypothetical protein